MNNFQIRAFVRELISEAKKAKAEKKGDKKPAKKAEKKDDKKEPKLPKSSGKLMDLKKEVAYLKEMASQLQATGLTEGEEQVTEVEFSNLQKFVNELSSVREASAKLKAKLDEEITATEAKIKAEKDKIKEMIGLVSEESTVVNEDKLTKQDLKNALKDKGIDLKDFIKDPSKFTSKHSDLKKYSDVTKDIIDSLYKDGKIEYDKLDETSFKKSTKKEAMEIGSKDFTYKDVTGKIKYVTADNLEQAKERVKKFDSKIDLSTVKPHEKAK